MGKIYKRKTGEIMIKKLYTYLRHPQYFLLWLDIKGIVRLPDDLYLKIFYKKKIGKKLNLKNPQTFNEKMQWLKLNDRKEIYTTMVDKYDVKKYVANIIGEEYIIPTIGVYDNFDNINFDELPNKFVIKCTHDSGGVVVCKDKSTFNIEIARKKINDCLKKNFYYLGREWPYKNVKPRIIIEKFLEDEKNEDLIDYKIMCFNGKAQCSFLCLNRRSKEGLNVDFYDLNWNKMPFERHYKQSNIVMEKPENYDLMIELAEKLAKNIPFVRVDFYDIKGKVYFGELTFYPGSGMEEFNPEEWDKKLGDLLVL